MATNGCCSPVKFYSTNDKAFYFEVAETDVDGDCLSISDELKHYYFQSKDNKFLLLKAEKFRVQSLSQYEQSQLGCKFNIQFFNDPDLGGDVKNKKGRPVMVYVEKDGKKMVACCTEGQEVCPVVMDIPCKLVDTKHKALFNMVETATSFHFFESTFYEKKYLGFEPDQDEPYLKKLVLRPKADDEVDESCQIRLI